MEELIGRIFGTVILIWSVLNIGVQHILLKTFILYRLKHSYNSLWSALGEPRLLQSTEFSECFVKLSMDIDKLESIKERRDFALFISLKAYGPIDKLGELMIIIALVLVLILSGFSLFSKLFGS
jgi:hypothetical protein